MPTLPDQTIPLGIEMCEKDDSYWVAHQAYETAKKYWEELEAKNALQGRQEREKFLYLNYTFVNLQRCLLIL